MDAIERALVPVWEAISRLRFSRPAGGSSLVEDPRPIFTPTGDPKVYNMPWPYLQDWIDANVGVVRLIPGTDFTASGTTFTFNATRWPSGVPSGDTFTVFRAKRTA